MDAIEHIFAELMHMLILGPTGVGKSRLTEAMVRHLALQFEQVCIILLDPGGSTARATERFLIQMQLHHRMIVLDPAEQSHVLAYNPLRRLPGLSLNMQARLVTQSILTALEIDQMDSVVYMPVLEQALYEVVKLLIEGNWTFHEASFLLTPEAQPEATAIISKSQDSSARTYWESLQRMKPQQRQQLLGLARARLMPFATSEFISRMTGQRERALDFPRLIEEGGILLANTEAFSGLTESDSAIISNLLISDVMKACFARPPETGRDVYLFVEEAGEGLVGSAIGKLLRRARKHRLHVILMNQDISSMREENPVVFRQLWANTTHKAIFCDLPIEDLQLIAETFFLEEMDPHAVKDTILRTLFAPRETTRTISGYSSSSTEFSGESSGSSAGEGMGTSLIMPGDNLIVPTMTGVPFQRVENDSESAGRSSSSSWGSASSDGYSEVEVPFYEFEERKEVGSRTFYSLEELLHLAKQKLKGLPKQHICMKRRGQPPQMLQVPFVDDIPDIEEFTKAAREEVFQNSGCYATLEEIEEEQARRTQELRRDTSEVITIE